MNINCFATNSRYKTKNNLSNNDQLTWSTRNIFKFWIAQRIMFSSYRVYRSSWPCKFENTHQQKKTKEQGKCVYSIQQQREDQCAFCFWYALCRSLFTNWLISEEVFRKLPLKHLAIFRNSSFQDLMKAGHIWHSRNPWKNTWCGEFRSA